MKSPIKLNNLILPKSLLNLLPSEEDPRNLIKGSRLSTKEFSKYIESIYFDGKFSKTTMPGRHSLSDKKILELISDNKDARILDVGASDGSTSLDLIKKLDGNFGKYFVTDVSFSLDVIEQDRKSYFYDTVRKECIMIVSNRLIIYHDKLSSSLIGYIAKRLIERAPKYDAQMMKQISLVQPELQKLVIGNSNIKLIEWSIFEPWPEEKADIIKVANVLKTEVFSEDEITEAIKNLIENLNPDGRIIIIQNSDKEKYSFYSKVGSSLRLEASENGGCDIDYLVKKI